MEVVRSFSRELRYVSISLARLFCVQGFELSDSRKVKGLDPIQVILDRPTLRSSGVNESVCGVLSCASIAVLKQLQLLSLVMEKARTFLKSSSSSVI